MLPRQPFFYNTCFLNISLACMGRPLQIKRQGGVSASQCEIPNKALCFKTEALLARQSDRKSQSQIPKEPVQVPLGVLYLSRVCCSPQSSGVKALAFINGTASKALAPTSRCLSPTLGFSIPHGISTNCPLHKNAMAQNSSVSYSLAQSEGQVL